MMQINTLRPHAFLIGKKKFKQMKVLEIQDLLSREIHFLKWQLVELLEMEERELVTLSGIKRFSELIEAI